MAVLVGKPAPDFEVTAVQGTETLEKFTLSQFKGKKYVVLFFYPLDFTFVCPTELHEFQARLPQFEELDTQVIGASTDSWFSHLAWLEQPRNQGGIQGVTYPILADFNKTVAQDYDLLLPGGMALRGSFLIDKEGIVQHQVVNNLPLGRNIDEMVRMVRALQFCEQHGEVCPANWTSEDQGMKPTHEGVAAYLSR
jgi:peroxiredoxin (alkyl hydroperoxide reductase subunit C)